MELKLDLKMLGVGQLTKVVEKLNKTNEKFAELKKNMDANKKAFSALSDSKFIRFFDTLNNKMFDIVKSQQAMKAAGGQVGLVGAKFAEFNGMLESFGAKSLLSKVKLVGSAFASWLAPLALIAGAMYLISRVWKENIGGIQTKWIKFMGKLKNTWSKFDIQLRKFLHEIGPAFSVIFDAGFALLEGIFEGLVTTVQILIGIFGPFLRMLAKFFSMFKGDGEKSLQVWKAIGNVVGMVASGLAAFMIIKKIIMFVKMLQAAFVVFNAIVTANPIGAIIVAIVAIIALVVYLQKRFNIFGKAAAWLAKTFKKIWAVLKKVFSIAVKTSPLYWGIMGIVKAIKWIKKFRSDKGTEQEAASSRAGNTVAQSSSVNNSNVDNRQANVTIHTQSMDPRQAQAVSNSFVSPVVGTNKSI